MKIGYWTKGAVLTSLLITSSAQADEARELSEAEKEAISVAVRERLRDPDSAQFKWGLLTGNSYCGMVNAKNAYGGYTGFSPYMVYTIKTEGVIEAAVAIGIGSGDTEEEATFIHCASKGYRRDYFYSLR